MKKLKWMLLIFFIILLGFSIFSIFSILKEEHHQEEIKDELIEQLKIPEEPSSEQEFSIDFNFLKNINSDVVGWIVMEGTQINYPIVQGSNNSYYLNHSYDKKYSGLGSIFMDFSSSSDFSDKNTFIYGHHTRNGSMFGEIKKYMKKEFYNDHPYFWLYTPENNYVAEIFSVYTADALSDSYNQSFASLDEYKLYIEQIREKSVYKTDVIVNYETDKIISLYSCSHEAGYSKTDRYFIHAILKKIN